MTLQFAPVTASQGPSGTEDLDSSLETWSRSFAPLQRSCGLASVRLHQAFIWMPESARADLFSMQFMR